MILSQNYQRFSFVKYHNTHYYPAYLGGRWQRRYRMFWLTDDRIYGYITISIAILLVVASPLLEIQLEWSIVSLVLGVSERSYGSTEQSE
jgi:hypothetical protein